MNKMDTGIHIPSPLQELQLSPAAKRNIRVYLKRDDLIHPLISGNKWRKLKYNLETARREGQDTLLTFGGAWSNHIHATAAAGKIFGFTTIGIIRGEVPERLSTTLHFAEKQGMKLHFVSREQYRRKNDSSFIQSLHDHYGNFYLIPEGGSNAEGVKGCEEILPEIGIHFDYFCLPCGTGTTLAGIINSANGQQITGFSALKDGSLLADEIRPHLKDSSSPVHMENRYSFGGYARTTPELLQFIVDFKNEHGILLDPVYTGKMMYGIIDLLEKDHYAPNTTLIALHTGGLQGISGFPDLHNALFTKPR